MTLDSLALKYGTDKGSKGHNYCPIYERHLNYLKTQPFTLLEIGIGGYHYPDRGGESLRMWADYFTHAKIVGVDTYDKSFLNSPRIQTFVGSQDDIEFLHRVVKLTGRPQVIIDDASHINYLTIKTFEVLFPLLAPGGVYVAEDVHTSYWFENYSGCANPLVGDTTMNYFKRLTDQLNYEVLQEKYREDFAGMIESISFYKELVIIKKL